MGMKPVSNDSEVAIGQAINVQPPHGSVNMSQMPMMQQMPMATGAV